jgi:hypothetical protein
MITLPVGVVMRIADCPSQSSSVLPGCAAPANGSHSTDRNSNARRWPQRACMADLLCWMF